MSKSKSKFKVQADEQSLPSNHRSAGGSSRAGSFRSTKSDISSYEISGRDDRPNTCGRRFARRLNRIEATNLRINPIDPGNWDEWGVYYCSSRFGRHTQFNPNYFALVAIILLGQSNFFHLIYLMNENGGIAFVVVLLMTYVFFGYPAYVMEMVMGQYSGRKPLQMIRLLLPLFSGLGVGLYIRTVHRALNTIGKFAICLYHCWDLLFCKGAGSVLIKRIITRERDYRKFKICEGVTHPIFTSDPDDGDFDEFKWVIIICSFSLLICAKKLKDFGAGMKVVLRLLLLFLTGYTVNAYTRTHVGLDYDHGKIDDSFIHLPQHITFKADWIQLFHGKVWVKATIFVMNSLELGTLVHSYFGSKMFFHYRCTRDGIYLILLTITWHLVGVLGVLLWLGYVTIDKQEMTTSLQEMNGLYGMFVVFILKHIQAEMTQQVESDVLLFCAVFYFVIGTTALLASICYLYIIVDCSVMESGHSTFKVFFAIFYVFWFGIILLPCGLSRDGLRHLIFLNFYGGFSWNGLFLVVCFSIAVSCSQGVGRVLYDFYNVIHLKGYELRTHYYPIPKIVVCLFTLLPLISMLREGIERTRPQEGVTDWSDKTSVLLGQFTIFMPISATILGMIIFLIKNRNNKTTPIFAPHRDFYKNKHHISVCFKDYMYFDQDKIPATGRKHGKKNI